MRKVDIRSGSTVWYRNQLWTLLEIRNGSAVIFQDQDFNKAKEVPVKSVRVCTNIGIISGKLAPGSVFVKDKKAFVVLLVGELVIKALCIASDDLGEIGNPFNVAPIGYYKDPLDSYAEAFYANLYDFKVQDIEVLDYRDLLRIFSTRDKVK